MALYKYSSLVQQTDIPEFDITYLPETAAFWPGIYLCQICGYGIVVALNQLLPPQNHHEHLSQSPVAWKLAVATKGGRA